VRRVIGNRDRPVRSVVGERVIEKRLNARVYERRTLRYADADRLGARYIGEDNLLVGSDYTHQDQSQEHGFVKELNDRVTAGEITDTTARKIMYNNPKAFYGL